MLGTNYMMIFAVEDVITQGRQYLMQFLGLNKLVAYGIVLTVHEPLELLKMELNIEEKKINVFACVHSNTYITLSYH